MKSTTIKLDKLKKRSLNGHDFKSQDLKLQQQLDANKVAENTVNGLVRQNQKSQQEVDNLRTDFNHLKEAYENETREVEQAKQDIAELRRRLTLMQREKIEMGNRLRSTKIAQELVEERYKDLERRNIAMKQAMTNAVTVGMAK